MTKSSFDFDGVISRKNTDCFKWDFVKYIFKTDDLLPMWVADMDFQAPPEVVAAIVKRAEHPVYGYGARPGSFNASFIAWCKKRFGYEVRNEWIEFSPGIVPALSIAVQAFTRPGEGVIVQPPVYPPFISVVNDCGRRLLANRLVEKNGRYEIDFADLESLMKNGAALMLFCSPHNPVGRVWTKDEITRVGELCVRYNVTLVSDEIHADIIFGGGRHVCTASVSKEIEARTVTLLSPSKTFNITGLSISSAVIENRALRETFHAFVERLHIGNTNVFGITAFEAAYTHGEKWLGELLSYLEANRDYAVGRINSKMRGAKAFSPEGTFLLWIDFRGLGLKQNELVDLMVKKARLGLNDGATFGPGGEGFMRLNFACPRKTLEEGLDRLEKALPA